MFDKKDLERIYKKDILVEEISNQLEHFRNGFPSLHIKKPARINDGILKIDEEKIHEYITLYDKSCISILKFVPASGAATRMFKLLFEFRDALSKINTVNDIPKIKFFHELEYFFANISKFAFYDKLESSIKNDQKDITALIKKKQYNTILDYILEKHGLNYAKLPKALIHFHKYPDSVRTAIEEHLAESAACSCKNEGITRIHFTIPEEHTEHFRNFIQSILPDYEKKFKTSFDISYSVQNPSTDTIAVDLDNNPFRDADGSLLFRPAGHGALLSNLNQLDADIVFIKNIDNIVPDKLKPDTIKYKKLLGGMLIHYRDKIYQYLKKLSRQPSDDLLDEIVYFIKKELCVDFDSKNYPEKNTLKDFLVKKLNRPLRICGMVGNLGEPGGGPYWTLNPDKTTSLQIVEATQINRKDSGQISIFNMSTYFNPVDMACSIKDYKGNKFNLEDFRNPDTGFISQKSKDGKALKALELPGLWNGSMSDWNTLLVEVPISTFNPVKTILDLLRKQHQ